MSDPRVPEPEAGAGSQEPGSPGSAGVAHPHDRYFRAVTRGRAEQVALVNTLFPDVAPLLDPDSIAPIDGTHVDDDLSLLQTDLALEVRLAGRDVILYVLIEHQRSVDPLMALRMVRYQTRIWDRYLKRSSGTKTLPPILSAVIYQGNRPWTAATELRELIDVDAETAALLGDQLPRWSYRLDDLTTVDAATLRARPLTPPLRLCMLVYAEVVGSPDPLAALRGLRDDIDEVGAGLDGASHLRVAFTYIVTVSDTPPDQVQPFADQLGPIAKEALMTTAQRLHDAGHAEGHAQGQAEVLLEQLTIKFGPQDADVQLRVMTAPSDHVHTWIRQILTATTVDEVFG